MIYVEKIWTIRGLETGRFLDGWFSVGDEGICPIDVSYLESYESEWGERVVIQLGYGVINSNISNCGKRWFYETEKQAREDNEDILKG